MTFPRRQRGAAPDWQRWAAPLVRWRHPLLLAFVLSQTWRSRSYADWGLLSDGARALFGPARFSVYSTVPGLQAGPPSLVAVRALNALGDTWGENAAHLALAILGWYLLFLLERWTVPGVRFGNAPLVPGLVTLGSGLLVLDAWVSLAGGNPHLDDGLALLTFGFAIRAVGQGRGLRAALLIGLAAAWKPWAIVALPLVRGLPNRWRALAIACAVPAACWLPFVMKDGSTVGSVSHHLQIEANSMLHVLGLFGSFVPSWWRGAQLCAALAVAWLGAVRRDWRVAFAAGCSARLLLDPAGFDYYVAGLLLATFMTERLSGLVPWRSALIWVVIVHLDPVLPTGLAAISRMAVLLLLTASWIHPWRVPDGIRAVGQELRDSYAGWFRLTGPRTHVARVETP